MSATLDINAEKAFSTMAARAALRGFTLTRSTETNGRVRFVIGKWNLLRFCDDMAEVEQFFGRAGVPS